MIALVRNGFLTSGLQLSEPGLCCCTHRRVAPANFRIGRANRKVWRRLAELIQSELGSVLTRADSVEKGPQPEHLGYAALNVD